MQRIVEADERTGRKILISLGVNDIDTKTPQEVCDQVIKLTELIRERYGNPKIILSELTPRNDEKDKEVLDCNQLLKTFADSAEHIIMAKQSGLRTEDGRHFEDAKHITRFAIPIFCASLKRALRTAYGVERRAGYGVRKANYNNNNNNNNNNTRGRGTGRRYGGRSGQYDNYRGNGRGGYQTRNQRNNQHNQHNNSYFPHINELENIIRRVVAETN